MRVLIAGLFAAAAMIAVPHAAAAAGTSMVGDDDCFGLAASCPDGTNWETGLGGVFFTANQGPGDAPFTDTWDSFVDPNFALATPGGSTASAMIVTRIAGVADNRGPWNVFINGFMVGTIPVNTDANAFQEVKTYSFNVPLADLLAVNNVVLGINDPTVNDGYDIDFVSLVTTGGGVPEPAAWSLMLMGFAGLGLAVRRQRRGSLAAA